MTESPAPLAEPDAIEAFLSRLSREPDLDAPELQAYDAADILLLQRAASLLAKHPLEEDRQLAVIGDRHGALTLGAAEFLGARGVRGVRVHQDPLLGERALAQNAARLAIEFAGGYEQHPLGAGLLSGVKLVLMQLPRSLAELDEIAWNIARFAHPGVVVLAGGRDKHMSRGMNEVLSRSFESVEAGRGWRKARVLTVQVPRAAAQLGETRFPVWGRDPELSFELAAFGATFGGAALDHGSRLLLRSLRDAPPRPAVPERIVDIGCGNGVLAVSAAKAWPQASVLASDQSAAAVAAAKLTAEAAGVLAPSLLPLLLPSLSPLPSLALDDEVPGVRVLRADAAEAIPDGWADLVLLNPPFHSGAAVHAGVAHRLIRSAAGALRPGGELRLVFNSHLGYRSLVERVVGPTRQLVRDKTFTVLAATRRQSA